MKLTKLIPVVLASVLWALACTGCNTLRGTGQDIEEAGEEIQDAAK